MWLLVAREPIADAPQWPGRKTLSALDAVTWPLAAALFVNNSSLPLGIFGSVLIAAALLLSVVRLRRAVWLNHRYRFTTWRWGGVVVFLMIVGAVLKMIA